MGQIIDGKAVSAKVKEEIRLETEKLKEQGIEIGLAVVIEIGKSTRLNSSHT